VIQAVIRFLIIGVVAAVGAFGANISVLKEAVDDPILASVVEALVIAALSAVTKYLGGPTEPARVSRGAAAGAAGEVKRPSPLAI
jgi:hypothetical protein